MKRPLMVLAFALGVLFALTAVGVFLAGSWGWAAVMAVCAVLGFCSAASGLDGARGNQPVAIIIDPLTGVPDFEGYRPMESELPQQQPEAELIQYEIRQESAEDILARTIAERAASPHT